MSVYTNIAKKRSKQAKEASSASPVNEESATSAHITPSQPTPPPSQELNGGTAFQAKVIQSTDQSTDRSASQSLSRPINRLPNGNASSNAIVDRPKAFYITTRLDKRLDEAVDYFRQVHGIKKADRSTVVNALMDSEDNWTEKSLDQLVNRLIGQLTSRLTGQ